MSDSYKVDYHIHSWYSDGTMKPTALVRQYYEEGYDIISITDHDGIGGVQEAMIAGEALKIKVISGVELAAEHHGIEIHLLGYQFDPEDPALLLKLEELRRYRDDRNKRLLSKLQEQGYDLTEEDLKQRPGQTYIGKPNFARALVAKGYISSPAEAFEPGKLLESPELKAIEREKISAAEAIDLLKRAGGMAVLAHPVKIRGLGQRGSEEFWKGLDKLLRELKKEGMAGLECFYPAHSEEEKLRLVDFAQKYHLHITEGSDFHGDDLRPQRQ